MIKSDKSVRICGDFKLTVHHVSKLDRHPIPKVEDLFAKLSGVIFSELDLSSAYQQLELDEESKQILSSIHTMVSFVSTICRSKFHPP